VTDLIRAVILGVIEGLTEFLPVSSTGHMILAMPWLEIDPAIDPWPSFLYFIQIGAILAVLIYFFRRLARQVFAKPTRGWRQHVLTRIVVGMTPAAVLGVTLNDLAERYLERPVPVALALILGGGLMIWIERACRQDRTIKIEDVTLKQAFLVGLAQCVSIIPGTSRSMATIMGGILVGLPGAVAAEFSFYLAIPTLIGAGLLRVAKHPQALSGPHVGIMATGFVVSFVVAWAVVALFMRYVQTRPLWPFGIYRAILGAAVLAGALCL